MDKFELDKINAEILNSIEASNTRIENKIENIIDKIDSNNKWIISVCITIIIATIILIIKLNS